jgi:hypothetical protein
MDKIIEKALLSVPAGSDYAKIVKDVVLLHNHYPDDWRGAWKELEAKWGEEDICGAGSTFNIDAKLNGAYIVMGLLYGEGDPMKTLEISTRCGQDSDCNPSNALAVLGVIRGFSNLPPEMKEGIMAVADSVFINTNYTFNRAVESSYRYALDFISKGGGTISDTEIRIRKQEPMAPRLEVAFPDLVLDHKTSVFADSAWKFRGDWQVFKLVPWGGEDPVPQAMVTGKQGDELEFSFDGTGVTLMGNWVKDGGKADVYLDGIFMRTIDAYFFYSNQEHHNINLWHAFGLQPGRHTLKLVVKGDKRPESAGTNLYITEALVFRTGLKKSQQHSFSFAQSR